MTRSPAADYAQRLQRVLDHLDAHLDLPPGPAALAGIAQFSPDHFHRVLAAWLGETLADYLHRRRLEVAALRLAAGTGEPVLAIALDLGFGSGDAFTRAFKERFGCTPGAWRAEAPTRHAARLERWRQPQRLSDRVSNDDAGTATGQAAGHGAPPNAATTVIDVRVVTLPPARVAYLRRAGPYGPELGDFWRDTALPWLRAHSLDGRPCCGIGHDDPALTDPARCRYDACIEVDERFVAPPPAGIAQLPGGRYAVGDFRGPPADLDRAWNALLGDWLPKSGLQIDDRPCFEQYPGDAFATPADGAFACAICIPVKPL